MAASPIQNGHFVHDNTTAPEHPGLLSLFSLKGKTAIITGAGAGIGLAVAQGLAEAGANVALWYNTNDKCHERAAEIAAKYGVQAKAYKVNTTDPAAVEAAINAGAKELNGRLDILIANAGVPWTKGPMVDGPLDHYSQVVDINLNSTFYCAKYAAAHWRRQKEEGTDLNGQPLTNFTYGSFVATASMSGHIVNFPQLQSAYNAAKSGVIHLCKSLAVEWVRFARANSVSPGYIVTEISNFVPQETKNIWKDKIPMGREGQVGELKGAYLYLASDASSYTTGADLVVDGGYTLP
ncbi:reductase with broad range of substrate specificity [Aspergillus steynii IBT 23096]|uniref:Reductase with broad range of substrate specificity n=1 Tax=Aspergillus steynii IBT 23096 TaxID=1392250 RepID=A0A2I2G5M3_9EURO|nr:reductase with broad range of substrate specificity [Aspergillus steynii IBT 23096]PLB48143.1 reductase with broad range of substrate specificity [Aspergillus steynii IBT 23096]